MNALRKDAFKSPFYHVAIIVLLALGLVSLPIDMLFNLFILDAHKAKLLGGITLRVVLSVFAVIAIKKYGFIKPFTSHDGIRAFLMVMPALVIAINNFPFSAIINDKVVFDCDAISVVLYVLYCISVGFFEELIYCGLVFPLCLYVCRHKKYSAVFAVAVSSAIFALSHIINLFSGMSVGATLLQIGYSFLIGAMCSISKCVTRNIFTAITLHTIYDIGGLLLGGIGIASGNQWDTFTIVFTAIIGVITAIYMIILAFKVDHDEVEGLYFTEEQSECGD